MVSPLIIRCTTHLEDLSGILHFWSGSDAHGRLDLTDTSLPDPLQFVFVSPRGGGADTSFDGSTRFTFE
eukprot:133740-Prorocentrum_minimum.AAC.1